jgi:hypothetical protein
MSIEYIIKHTNYTDEEAQTKLIAFNGNAEKVVRDYLGIVEKPAKPIKSLNQEIYRQFREKLTIASSFTEGSGSG